MTLFCRLIGLSACFFAPGLATRWAALSFKVGEVCAAVTDNFLIFWGDTVKFESIIFMLEFFDVAFGDMNVLNRCDGVSARSVYLNVLTPPC